MVRMREFIDAATGKWSEILKRYGVNETALTGRHGPCPICGGADRFRFDNKGGTGSWFCSHCGAGFGLALLERVTGRPKADLMAEVAAMVGTLPAASWTPAPDMRKRIAWVTANLVSVHQVPEVMAYLRGRGLRPSSDLFAVPKVRYYDQGKLIGEFPAMVARYYSPSGDLLTYHLTHVQGGRKAEVPSPRKLLTPLGSLPGGSLRLTRVYPSLGLAEGVETALAVMRDFGIPCWAAANAGMMEKFQPPEGVTALTVYADNDKSFTGQRAAFALAHRLANQGIAVDVCIPDQVGDFADRIPERKDHARVA